MYFHCCSCINTWIFSQHCFSFRTWRIHLMAGPGIWPIWLCCESPCPATSVLRTCPSCRSESSCCIDSGMKSATRYRALVYSACGNLLIYWMFSILWIWPVAVTSGTWRCHNLTHWFCLCSSLRYQTVALVSNKIIRLLHLVWMCQLASLMCSSQECYRIFAWLLNTTESYKRRVLRLSIQEDKTVAQTKAFPLFFFSHWLQIPVTYEHTVHCSSDSWIITHNGISL